MLSHFSDDERKRIGVHTCPGGDHDSTHSADVELCQLAASALSDEGRALHVQLASETDRRHVLEKLRSLLKPGQRLFVGVTDPINPAIESTETVRDRVLEAAEFISIDALGTTDDCGFAPFADDTSRSRETAFAKIKSRVEGTAMAATALGV